MELVYFNQREMRLHTYIHIFNCPIPPFRFRRHRRRPFDPGQGWYGMYGMEPVQVLSVFGFFIPGGLVLIRLDSELGLGWNEGSYACLGRLTLVFYLTTYCCCYFTFCWLSRFTVFEL